MSDSLAMRLQGSWELVSRIDRARDGAVREEPSLGSDPIAFLVFDRTGHFAAQFKTRSIDRRGCSGGHQQQPRPPSTGEPVKRTLKWRRVA